MCLNPIGGRKVIGVTGIRGTGKTVGLFHVIDELNDYENTVFIEVREKGVTMRDLIKVMRQFSCKHFFIDEISRINNFIEDSYYLDEWTNSGINVIVSGTNSYAITASRESGLFHRIVFIRTTHITIREQNRLTGISLDDYIKFGGILDKSLLDVYSSNDLASALVLDNITNSIFTNLDYFKFCQKFSRGFYSLTEPEMHLYIKSVVFYIYYMVIISKVTKPSKKILNRYADKKYIGEHRKFLEYMGIDLDFEAADYFSILTILKYMECIYETSNVDDIGCRFYITTPYIAYNMFKDFERLTNIPSNYSLTEETIFEDITVCEILKCMGVGGFSVTDNNEIDCVLLGSDDVRTIAINTNERLNRYKNYASNVLVFISYALIAIVIPHVMFYFDPTSVIAYCFFIGTISFIILGLVTPFFNKNMLHSFIASALAITPILIYFEIATKVVIYPWEILYYVLFVISYCLLLKIQKINLKSNINKMIKSISLGMLIFLSIAYVVLCIISFITYDESYSAPIYTQPLVYTIIFIVPIILSILVYIIFRKKS